MSLVPPLGTFLRIWRLRVSKDVIALGPYRRLPSRIGRRVTQEELAEVVGVSRGWYTTVESNAAIRTSPRVLARIGAALMLSGSEKAHHVALLHWGLLSPEQRQVEGVQDDQRTQRDRG
jgi:transcriptional regulator with XRE-family HTH domain